MSGFRRNGRKPLQYWVKLSHKHVGDFRTVTHDISDTGIYVLSPELPKLVLVGETMQAELRCDQNLVENTQLKVVRLTDEGVGLAFE